MNGARVCAVLGLVLLGAMAAAFGSDEYAEIRVVDDRTGRGVPLVELTTVDKVSFVSDSAGRIALREPGWWGRKIFFHVRSHGYEYPRDGFGFRGVRLQLAPGKSSTVRVHRLNLAERLYRITGEGIYRDSVLLGKKTPLAKGAGGLLGPGAVAGQDSAFAVPYGGRIHWFWGDTSRLAYPLGHFRMAGATSALPSKGGLDPASGIDLEYFVDDSGFSRPMCHLGLDRGLVWADAFVALADAKGRQRLVCHYAQMESLAKMIGHGLAVYDDAKDVFELVRKLDLESSWKWPGQAHPVRYEQDGREHLLLGEMYPTTRVPATYEDFMNPESYEAWTCLRDGSTRRDPEVDRDAAGRLRWTWRGNAVPVDSKLEARLLRQGDIRPDEARYNPVDIDSGKRVLLVRGSVSWNEHRKAWILVGGEQGGTSPLGEIWISTAAAPTGPWRRAKKIVTHEKYSFYNPVHHSFYDQAGGALIYFEGTYVTTFSGNPRPTPRYDYNQILYRLDLRDERLSELFAQ